MGHPDQAKARKAIAVPLSAAAVIVLREQLGRHVENVFTYKGKPVQQVNGKAWKGALVRAGFADFRWHDLRHIWASWHVQAGTPLHVLQELGSWESVELVRRYAHLSGTLTAIAPPGRSPKAVSRRLPVSALYKSDPGPPPLAAALEGASPPAFRGPECKYATRCAFRTTCAY